MHQHTRRHAPRGFTLIELMVVIVIIGLLASIVTVRYLNALEKSKGEVAAAQISQFKAGLQAFYLDQGFYPTSEMGLDALINQPSDTRIENYPEGGYLDTAEIPKDPWGNPYEYTSPGSHSKDYDISSLGKDGLVGGEGFDADIESWKL